MESADKNTLNIGAIVSVVQSSLFWLIALFVWCLGINIFVTGEFASLYEQNEITFTLFCAAFVIIAILGIVITPAEKQIVGKYNKALANLGGNLAYVGHFGTILFFLWWLLFSALHNNNTIYLQLAGTFGPIQWGVLFDLLFVGLWVWTIAYTIFRYGGLSQ